MIKFNDNNINDFNLGWDNIIKVYHQGAVCYYKITTSGGTSAQTPCYAVVDDITQYQDTEFEDVFNKADGKWYKLNNLNQYEQYGVYASGRTQCSGTQPQRPSYKYWLWRSCGELESGGIIQFSEFDLVVNHADVNLSFISCTPAGFSGEGGANLFDNNLETKYCARLTSYQYTNYVLFEAPSAIAPTTFSMTTAGDSSAYQRYPREWELYGSNTSTTNWNDGSWDLVLSGTCGSEMCVNDTRFDYEIGEPTEDCVTTYEGKLTIDDGYEYIYSGGSWISLGEVSGGTATLPNKPFTINYNAKYYDSQTNTLPKTSGQLADVDAVISGGTPTINDDHLTISYGTKAVITDYSSYFNRDSSNPTLTIISKQNTTSSLSCHLLANRAYAYNWMYRAYSNRLTLHGTSEQGGVAVTTQPVTVSVRVDSGKTATYNNYTDNTTSAFTNFSYGSTNSGGVALFAGYATDQGEYFQGDFYWIYMSQSYLTDEEVQQVITYNENEYQIIYPKYYDEIQDPPNNVSFSSMTEAEQYECPWVGMKAIIDGSPYVFSGDSISGYEWVYVSSRLPIGYTEVEYIENSGTSYLDLNFVPNADTRILCDMQQVTMLTRDYPRLWGAGAWDNYSGICMDYQDGYLSVSWFRISDWTHYTSVPNNTDRHVYDFNKNYLYVDNTEIGYSTYYEGMTATDNLGVFTYILNGRPSSSSYWGREHFLGKMYSFKVYDDGTLVIDLVPCIRDLDNKPGAYDIVNNVFYTVPSGYSTDNFIAGNEVT